MKLIDHHQLSLHMPSPHPGLPPADAVNVLGPLEQARKKLILKTGFHLVFLVTPTNTSIEPDWSQYENIANILHRENKVRHLFSLFFSFYSVLSAVTYSASASIL